MIEFYIYTNIFTFLFFYSIKMKLFFCWRFCPYKIFYGEKLQFLYILNVRLDYYVLSNNTNEIVVAIIVIGYFGTDLVLDGLAV